MKITFGGLVSELSFCTTSHEGKTKIGMITGRRNNKRDLDISEILKPRRSENDIFYSQKSRIQVGNTE